MADITGTPGVDSLFGSLSADEIVALEGNDVAFGSDGDDLIFGNSGNDALAGNQGNDTINSGRDNDVILSGQGDDISRGDDGNDWVFGNLGSDTVFGNIGDDSIFGGQGNDVIYGGQGNDVISGDFGNDVIFGDKGADSLSGGAGNDIFVLTKSGGGATLADADVISDFREGDRLGIAPGLTLAAINIQFVPGSNSLGDVIIRDLSDNTGSYLAIVQNVPQNLITRDIFTTDLTPIADDDDGGGDDGGGDDGGGDDGGGGSIEPTPPLARTLSLNIGEDTPISTQFDASDANNDPLTFSIVEAPSNGTASLFGLPNGFFTYIPGANFSGSDSFTYQVNDGTELSNVATVNINIFPLEDVPVADAKTLGVDFTQPSPITLSGTDGDGDSLSFRILSLPDENTGRLFQTADGNTLGAEITETNTVVNNPEGIVIFVPTPGATGTDSFEYVANDTKADSVEATVALTLGNVLPNSAPGIDLNGDAVDGLDFTARFRGTPVAIVDATNLNVGDADNDDIKSATIAISNLLDEGNESLEINDLLAAEKGITVDRSIAGTLTLTGFATVSNYAEVLRTITYNNTAATPNLSARTVTFVVNDGKDNSVTPVSTLLFPVEIVEDNTANTIVGTVGPDDITGARGADTMTGGGGEDVFIYRNELDGSGLFNARSGDRINTRVNNIEDYDVITDFVRGIDKIGFASGFDDVNDLNDILPTVRTTIDIDENVLSGTQRIFAYETGGSTYIIHDNTGNNTDGNDNRTLVKLQGISGLGTLTANDFDFIP